jgi:hypothetical protein
VIDESELQNDKHHGASISTLLEIEIN